MDLRIPHNVHRIRFIAFLQRGEMSAHKQPEEARECCVGPINSESDVKNGQVRCRDESAIFPLFTDLIVLVARHVEGADDLQAAFICSVVTLTLWYVLMKDYSKGIKEHGLQDLTLLLPL